MEHNSRMKEITGNLKRDMKDLLGESANVVTGLFRRGVCTVRAVADKWRTFTQDISAAVDELMKPPFLADGPEAPLPTMDKGAEPVVTVVESMDQNFPIGKQMPLSQANDEAARTDAAYLEEELTTQPVKVRIDYIQNGQIDRYYLPLHIGAGENLLEQMERHLETYRADPDRVAALFQQAPEEYRREFEAEFTPFLHESLEGLSQETLRYFQRHCDISELARQFESQGIGAPGGPAGRLCGKGPQDHSQPSPHGKRHREPAGAHSPGGAGTGRNSFAHTGPGTGRGLHRHTESRTFGGGRTDPARREGQTAPSQAGAGRTAPAAKGPAHAPAMKRAAYGTAGALPLLLHPAARGHRDLSQGPG